LLIKKIVILFWCLILLGEVNGQHRRPQYKSTQTNNTASISGTVTDDRGNPIPFASVVLYKQSDSSMVNGTASNNDGEFSIQANPGSYYLLATFLSYKMKVVDNIQLNQKGVHLGKLILLQESTTLGDVSITAQKSEMELKLDKRIFHVGKDLANTGSNGAEILDNVPSVSVDVDGNVSLRGSEGVRILIDGKPSGLMGVNSADALRQLQGNMIDRVEIITNPSARYDAEGEVGIINIILKKERRKGFNGSLQITGGYPDNYKGGFSLNYRKKSINFFTSYGLSYRKTPGSGYSWQEFSKDSTYKSDRVRDHTRGGLSNNLRIGTDFFLDKYNTLTVSGLYRVSTGTNDALIIYNDFDSKDQLTQTVTRDEDEEESKQNIETTFSYKKTYSKKDKEWTVDIKWMQSDDSESGNLIETNTRRILPVNQRTSNTEDEKNWLFQTDYVEPLGKNFRFETGAKSTIRTINNAYKVELQGKDKSWTSVEAYDNHFIYDEEIYAGYLILSKQAKKFSIQLGLRAEFSDITTELKNTNVLHNREYFGMFPSLHFSFKVDSSNTLQLSYSRRLTRPRFWHLLPFFGFSDNRNFFSGNPDLKPEYTHSLEMGYLKYFENGSLLSSVYYRYRSGVIERITAVDSTGYTRRFPINLSFQNAFGIEFDINYQIVKWWQLNGSFNFYQAITEGNYNGEEYGSDTYSWRARGSTKITFFKKVNSQISIRYRAPRETTQGRSLASYSVDVGISMEILKKKGTISINVKDLFNTRKHRSITENIPDYYSESEFQWRSRQILLSFNYRINQKKKRSRSYQNGGFDGNDMEF